MSNTVRRENALYEYIIPHNYGDIIRYQEIERVTGAKRGASAYYSAIAKAKKMLEADGKMIVSIEGGDYRIIYPGDYTDAYKGEVKRAFRRLKHGKKILDGAPTKDMTEEELQTYNRVYDFNSRLVAQFSGNVTEIKKLVGKKHPLECAMKQSEV